jgi:hypothetical protein
MRFLWKCLWIPGVVLFFLAIGACASIPRLNVAYVVPAGNVASPLKEVGLKVEDARRSGAIFGPGAEARQGGNIEVVSMSAGAAAGDAAPEGIYDVSGLMQEAFKRKFPVEGFKPIPEAAGDIPVVVIVIKKFFLDVMKHNWIGEIAYDAKLVVNGAVKITRSIEGTGKRLNVLGRADADALIGELFTDCVNRLDLEGLFEVAERALP